MLNAYRVLDLTDERGLICGQMLADLGADVIQVEPPGGSPARRIGPFYQGDYDPERSLTWWAYTRGKRSVELDIDSNDGRAAFRQLVESADFLIESDTPGTMAGRGLGYEDLAEINPGLIYVSITPHGFDGPKAHYAATDITIAASSGLQHLSGDPDRAPVRVTVPQSFLHGAAEAAGAALIALHERKRSGKGQHVDTSAQQSMNLATLAQMLGIAVGDNETNRSPGGIAVGDLMVRLLWEAKDGYVSYSFFFGSSVGPFTRRLMEWIHEEGGCDAATRDKDWIGYLPLLISGEETREEFERVTNVIAAFLKTKTKAELLEAALSRRLLLAPIQTIPEVVSSEQLEARGYWQELEHTDVGATIKYPGAAVKLSGRPINYARRPPRIGEHTAEVLAETRSRLSLSPGSSYQEGQRPLEGLKVLDFTWVQAGPAMTRILSDFGATVIRVESSGRPGMGRTMYPYNGGTPGPESSAFFGSLNAGKHGITLNLATEDGKEVARDLVNWADIVAEAFTPKTMPAWGLGYESLRKMKPEIIMLRTCLFGQDGPLSGIGGFGTMASAISGYVNLAGYPDRPPVGPFGAYTDAVSPRFALAALLAALDHRDRSGEGQLIDQAQFESGLHFLAPTILDYFCNGHETRRDANRDPSMAPHGVYESNGEDDWVAIAARDDADWEKLAGVISRSDLAADTRYSSAEGRLEDQGTLDEAITAWTSQRSPLEAEETLQAAGVPAYGLVRTANALADAQLQHRGHFVELPHSDFGRTYVEGPRFRLSRTPPRVDRVAPKFGQDNEYVLKEILSYSDGRVAELAIAGALE